MYIIQNSLQYYLLLRTNYEYNKVCLIVRTRLSHAKRWPTLTCFSARAYGLSLCMDLHCPAWIRIDLHVLGAH